MIVYQWSQVSQLIWFKIDVFDENLKFTNSDDAETEKEDSQPDTMKQGGSFKIGHVTLGAVQKPSSFEQVSAAHKDDPAFSNFHNKFCHFVRPQYISKFANFDMVLDQKFKVCFYNSSTALTSDLNTKIDI